MFNRFLSRFLARLFGSRNQRLVRQLQRQVEKINVLEPEMQALSDEQLQARTLEFRERLVKGEALEALLPEAFATVREAGWRVFKMRHFDVQMIGGMVLNQGKIAEMKTGEGKTLVATLAVYLNALTQRGVHVVTVNDYLAQRDAEWMGQLYNFLGMEVGVIRTGQSPEEKRAAYAADITYGTNNEFGFDYLRDNMAFSSDERMQREPYFAVIDEVDSILIDEARTPLIISAPTDDDPELYRRINGLVPKLVRQEADVQETKAGEEETEAAGDYSVDEKSKAVYLTEEGHQNAEELLTNAGLLGEGESLYDASNLVLMHHLTAALRAHNLYQRDVEYIVSDREVVIVDEFTGRTMPGRRWSDGLHQAVEAKEGVPIQRENQTLASITFQNYFRLYEKLSGMTGTADTEAFEFQSIYGLEVVVIPTNKPMLRLDQPDQIYMNTADKFEAIVNEIETSREKQQPVLVGTASIDTSELLHGMLKQRKIPCRVLNAKQHESEAEIIAQAGLPGTVTIATNMAGRGTDIVLGGNLEVELAGLGEDVDAATTAQHTAAWEKRHAAVLESGGLKVIGSERHESRRIDNQLRGRSGRQGDPGETRFYLSLEDTLMRIFTPPRLRSMLQRLGMEKGEAIEHRWVSRAIENAQRKVEAHNFDIRKNLLQYDNVANDQRKVVYDQRNELMSSDDVSEVIESIWIDVVQQLINAHIPMNSLEEQWDVDGLTEALQAEFGSALPIRQWLDDEDNLDEAGLRERILDKLSQHYRAKREEVGDEVMNRIEKAVMLQVLDTLWREHLAAMDYLRQGIHLRGYAQKDPKQEYKREAFDLFVSMLDRLKHETVTILARGQLRAEENADLEEQKRRREEQMQFEHAQAPEAAQEQPPSEQQAPAGMPFSPQQRTEMPKVETFVRDDEKVGRNDPCPCGSGKKYKQCHGKLA